MSVSVPADDVARFLGSIEPELWQGGLDDNGFDWREVARIYLRKDAGRLCALAMALVRHGSNREPVIVTDSPHPGMWDGNHRAVCALAMRLPLRYVAVSESALLSAANHGYPAGSRGPRGAVHRHST